MFLCIWFKNIWLAYVVRVRSLVMIKLWIILIIIIFIIWWKIIRCIKRCLMFISVCCFFNFDFAEKMDNFRFGLVKLVGNYWNYWVWWCLLEILSVQKWMILCICLRVFSCLWSIYIVIITFCKIISSECSLFLRWFCHWSKCLVIHMWIFWNNGGFNRRL